MYLVNAAALKRKIRFAYLVRTKHKLITEAQKCSTKLVSDKKVLEQCFITIYTV